jgi:hypothetical protein
MCPVSVSIEIGFWKIIIYHVDMYSIGRIDCEISKMFRNIWFLC